MRQTFTYQIPPEEKEMSVQNLLLAHGYSKRLIIDLKAIPDGLTVCGKRVCTPYLIQPGEVLTVCLPQDENSLHIDPICLPLSIVYEDDHIMVVNKPAGMPIHPSQGNHDNSLANAVAWYFTQKKIPFTFRVINRLDRDTTGLLTIAKHPLSACILSDMIRRREIHRTYLAAVHGHLEPQTGTIKAPIARIDGSTIERQVDFEKGEDAVTHYQVLSYQKATDTSLVKLHLDTGRTHQIRVHMKYLGFPLYGDFLYNPDYQYINRQSLHSWKLEFPHPITKEPLAFTAAVPDDMKLFLSTDEGPLDNDFS